jgi:hypothetical protein
MAKKNEPVKRFGGWLIYENGDMYQQNFEYEITFDRLNESDWWSFFVTEPNFNWNEFIPAYFYACKLAKVETLNLNLSLIQ